MKKTLFILISLVLSIGFAVAEDMPGGYYDAVNGTKDGKLKGTLKLIIRDHTVIPYGDDTWGVFYYSDQDENGYCMDMYCDDWKKFGAPGSAVSGCNIEHSFAKSWWGGAENDAYKDCYHLNPSNSRANSARSNYPLGVPVKDVKTAGSLKIGKIHHETLDVDFSVFEPKDEYKGDFARAYFYMATCYGKDINGNYDPTICSKYKGWRLDNKDVGSKFAMQNDNYLEFQPWEQEVLITWHRQDPVSEKEIKRADAVSNFQHNRNPFIDYPYLAEYIWGAHAGEEVNMSQLIASFEDGFVPGVSNGWRDGDVPGVVKPKYGVTWMVDSDVIRLDSVMENKKVTALPDAPEACSMESETFMGWTTTPIQGTSDQAPEVLYIAASELPAITADITLYAVFARENVQSGAAPAVYTYDAEHEQGWTNTGTDKDSYWLLDSGKELTSPEIDLAGLSTITVTIATYGGKEYNTLQIKANGEDIGSITTDKSTTLTEFTWTNSASLTGISPITFYSNYGANKGIRISSATINATGASVTYDRYITSCTETTEVTVIPTKPTATKVLRDGQIVIICNGREYNILGR